MEEKNKADPPPHYSDQAQSNPAYEQAPPYYPGSQNTPTYPGSQNTPTYPGSQNTPTYPGSQNTPTYPGSQNTPTYPGSQNTPTPPGVNYQHPGQGYAVSTVVYNQPQPVNNVMISPIQDNMGMAIFATFCCFWPLGLVAILRSSEVKSALAVNDLARAQKLAEESRRLSRYSIIIGALILVGVFVSVILIQVLPVFSS